MQKIRTATFEDLDAIAAVEAACFPAAEAATKEEFAGDRSITLALALIVPDEVFERMTDGNYAVYLNGHKWSFHLVFS